MLSTVETGTNRAVLSVIRDLSEKARIEEELEQKRARKALSGRGTQHGTQV